MHSNLFHLDWERIFESLVAVIAFSFLAEQTRSPHFESQPFPLKSDLIGAIRGIEQIEQSTSLDFFAGLPVVLESVIERGRTNGVWPLPGSPN